MTRRDISIKDLQISLKAASKAARKEAKDHNVATTFVKGGIIYKLLPNGTVEEIGKIEDSESTISGLSFSL